MFRAALLFSLAVITAYAQLSPEESLAKMKVADGLEMTLFAGEPDLYNPTSIDVDAQGRVWVCEARNYRLFNQPITDKAGDRIRVLEDTDGDGRCDKATTFYQDPTLQAPMGIAVLGDRVYICQSPDLFYLQDTNGDGVADKRVVVLTGFGGIDNDHAIHGVSWAADGSLYFSNGDQGLDVTDKSGNRVYVGKTAPHKAATVMRSDLEGNHLELLAEGMRNPYEACVDPYGNVFISDNDDDGNEQCRINYIMEGANYGYWPKRKGDKHLDEVHWNTDRPGVMPTMVKTGFGSPCGMLFYQGTLLPAQYQNTLIHADAGPRVIRSYRPTPAGAGFTANIDVLVSNDDDTWFRPSDVCAAPDGSIFICDWYDPGVGGHRMKDVSRGRIYRLAPKGVKFTVPPLDIHTDAGLMAALNSPNQARRFLAAQECAARVASGNASFLERAASEGDGSDRARALWAVANSKKSGEPKAVAAALKDKSPLLRTEAVRILSRAGASDKLLSHVNDKDAGVRRQIAISIAPSMDRPKIAKALMELASDYDGSDRMYREAIGIALRGHESWAFGDLTSRLGDTWDARFAGLTVQLHPPDAIPLAQAALANAKLDSPLKSLALDALDAIGTKEAGRQIVTVLSSNSSAEVKAHALHLLARDEGEAWREVASNGELKAYITNAMKDPALRDGAWAFINETRFSEMLPEVVALAIDKKQPAADRVKALDTVQLLAAKASRSEMGSYLKPVSNLLADDDQATRVASVKALGAFRGDEATGVLKNTLTDANASVEIRREALHSLGATKGGSNALMALAEKGKLPKDLLLDAGEMLHSNPNENIRLMAEKVFPRNATRDGAQLPPLNELLTMKGDPGHGKEVFFSPDRAQCYRCHIIYGEGKLVGPDLSKIGLKASKENLFDSILNPSAAVAPEYKVWIVSTLEDGSVSGFIRSENAESIEMVDSSGATIKINPKDVLDRNQSSASLMPNGLTSALTAQELADVVAFLQSLK